MKHPRLYATYFTQYHRKCEILDKPESIKYKCFLDALRTYAFTVNKGFDLLYGKEDVCGVHLLRMLLDACSRAYGILLVKNPEKYLDNFFADKPINKNIHKDTKKTLSEGGIIEAAEVDYPKIKEIWDESNRFIHPSNFYAIGVDLDEETQNKLYGKQREALVASHYSLDRWKEKKWIAKMMAIVNEILLDIMDKIIELAPKPEPIVLPYIIDLNQGGKIVPNPKYKPNEDETI